MENNQLIHVEVVYANPKKQIIIPLVMPVDSTVQAAIDCSKILLRFPEIDLQRNKIGIFSKLCRLETVLQEGDRVEIYRSLIADPKIVRQQRAKLNLNQ